MQVSFSSAPLVGQAADLVAVAVKLGTLSQTLALLDGADGFAGTLAGVTSDEDFTGKGGSSLAVPGFGKIAAKRLILFGVGNATNAELRIAAGALGTQARARGAKTVAFAFPGLDLGSADVRTVVETFAEGNYRFDKYKSESAKKAAAQSLVLSGVGADEASARAGVILAEAQAFARDLVNEPAAEIYPETLAAAAVGLANDRLTVTVWDEAKIIAEGMGGIAGVGQGSERPPRFVHMRYEPAGTPTRHIALVGKGVTFDSGGLSLKPNDGMLTMRCDMGGAAAVIGTMKAIRDLAPNVRVDGIFGAVENMPSGKSYKLGDILKMHNGKRVEIHNTDAEGRLVLADCLSYASKLNPDVLIDLATLTGAAVVALGDFYSALYARQDGLAAELLGEAGGAGEGLWRMPLPDLYKDKLKAEWGDLKNVGGRAGGSITAALFLSEFAATPNWAHIDIAGPAFMESPLQHFVQGGTGHMVRTLARWISK